MFYNGKTYKLDYDYAPASSSFNMRVSGMGPAQQADAVGLSTSALGHFACPSGHASLSGKPNYAGGMWAVPGRCA